MVVGPSHKAEKKKPSLIRRFFRRITKHGDSSESSSSEAPVQTEAKSSKQDELETEFLIEIDVAYPNDTPIKQRLNNIKIRMKELANSVLKKGKKNKTNPGSIKSKLTQSTSPADHLDHMMADMGEWSKQVPIAKQEVCSSHYGSEIKSSLLYPENRVEKTTQTYSTVPKREEREPPSHPPPPPPPSIPKSSNLARVPLQDQSFHLYSSIHLSDIETPPQGSQPIIRLQKNPDLPSLTRSSDREINDFYENGFAHMPAKMFRKTLEYLKYDLPTTVECRKVCSKWDKQIKEYYDQCDTLVFRHDFLSQINSLLGNQPVVHTYHYPPNHQIGLDFSMVRYQMELNRSRNRIRETQPRRTSLLTALHQIIINLPETSRNMRILDWSYFSSHYSMKFEQNFHLLNVIVGHLPLLENLDLRRADLTFLTSEWNEERVTTPEKVFFHDFIKPMNRFFTDISLVKAKITDESVEWILEYCPKLEKLRLDKTEITGQCLRKITETSCLKSLYMNNMSLSFDWIHVYELLRKYHNLRDLGLVTPSSSMYRQAVLEAIFMGPNKIRRLEFWLSSLVMTEFLNVVSDSHLASLNSLVELRLFVDFSVEKSTSDYSRHRFSEVLNGLTFKLIRSLLRLNLLWISSNCGAACDARSFNFSSSSLQNLYLGRFDLHSQFNFSWLYNHKSASYNSRSGQVRRYQFAWLKSLKRLSIQCFMCDLNQLRRLLDSCPSLTDLEFQPNTAATHQHLVNLLNTFFEYPDRVFNIFGLVSPQSFDFFRQWCANQNELFDVYITLGSIKCQNICLYDRKMDVFNIDCIDDTDLYEDLAYNSNDETYEEHTTEHHYTGSETITLSVLDSSMSRLVPQSDQAGQSIIARSLDDTMPQEMASERMNLIEPDLETIEEQISEYLSGESMMFE